MARAAACRETCTRCLEVAARSWQRSQEALPPLRGLQEGNRELGELGSPLPASRPPPAAGETSRRCWQVPISRESAISPAPSRPHLPKSGGGGGRARLRLPSPFALGGGGGGGASSSSPYRSSALGRAAVLHPARHWADFSPLGGTGASGAEPAFCT